jgi:hypothetical protein
MSEIKGQLLGMLLVIGIFTVIWGVLRVSFQDAATRVGNDIDLGLAEEEESSSSSSSNSLGKQNVAHGFEFAM